VRVLESYGIDAEKDIKRERLGVAESAGALRTGRSTPLPGMAGCPPPPSWIWRLRRGQIKVLSNAENLDFLTKKYGPVYFKTLIPKAIYPGHGSGRGRRGVANLLISHEKMDTALGYNITKVLLERQPELVACP